MTHVSSNLYRINDQKLIRLSIKLDYGGFYDRCEISVRHGQSPATLVATSEGAIKNNQLSLTSIAKNIELDLEHVHYLEQLDCLISYLQGNDIIHAESVIAYVERSSSIDSPPVTINTVTTNHGDYQHRMLQLRESLRKRISPWRIQVTIGNDIIGHVKSHNKKKLLIVFGEVSMEILASDLIFVADPNISNIVVPVEVFWKNYNMYNPEARMVFSEIVKSDFHAFDVYYKSPISNMITMSSLPRKPEVQLRDFMTPIGTEFNIANWKIDGQSNLPVLLH